MDAKTTKTMGPLFAVLLLSVAVSLYLVGYSVLGEKSDWIFEQGPGTLRIRAYSHQWEAGVYRPMARLESLWTKTEVTTRQELEARVNR